MLGRIEMDGPEASPQALENVGLALRLAVFWGSATMRAMAAVRRRLEGRGRRVMVRRGVPVACAHHAVGLP